MTTRWLFLHCFWVLSALAPILAQAAGPAPGTGGITTPGPRGPDAAKLAALLPAFEAYAEQARATWGTPGMAIAMVHQDRAIYAKGFGVKQLGGTDSVDPHTLFPIGSTSKAFTSALVALLADEGKLRWEDPVVDHVPAFETYDPWVTRAFMIEDLMAQRSGMSPYAGDLLAVIGFDAPAIRAQIKQMPLVSSFRSRFAYVNNLFLVAAEVIWRHTGLPWADAVQPAHPTPALPLSSYTGTFRHRVYGDLVIEVAGDTLDLAVGPRRMRMALRHWNRNTFLVSWPENDAYPGESGFARSHRGGAIGYPFRYLSNQAMVLVQASFAASCR
jgi:Beta-lactamase/Domain of unknown function (DUF3471)